MAITLNDRVAKAFTKSATKYTARKGSSFLYFEFVPVSKGFSGSGTLIGYTKSRQAIATQVKASQLRFFLEHDAKLRGQAFNQIIADNSKFATSARRVEPYDFLTMLADLKKQVVFAARKNGHFDKFLVKHDGLTNESFTVEGVLKLKGRKVVLQLSYRETSELLAAPLSSRGKVFSKLANGAKASLSL
jgi:hypothetical protein